MGRLGYNPVRRMRVLSRWLWSSRGYWHRNPPWVRQGPLCPCTFPFEVIDSYDIPPNLHWQVTGARVPICIYCLNLMPTVTVALPRVLGSGDASTDWGTSRSSPAMSPGWVGNRRAYTLYTEQFLRRVTPETRGVRVRLIIHGISRKRWIALLDCKYVKPQASGLRSQ
jgi:hypothetical protein